MELANIELKRKNAEQVETIASMEKTLNDERLRVRSEIATIQKDLHCFEQQRNNINDSFKNIQKIVHHGAAATKFFKQNYDRKVVELQRLTGELVMAKQQNNTVAVSGKVWTEQEAMLAEMQTKLERLLDKRNQLKAQIDTQTNDFANNLALSTEIIAQLTAELTEIRSKGKSSTAGDGSTTKIE